MIRLYCNRQHRSGRRLCNDCSRLNDYARERLSKCKFGDNKPACVDCTIHCYQAEMRAKIREVMRYSGPRMLLYCPVQFFKHVLKK